MSKPNRVRRFDHPLVVLSFLAPALVMMLAIRIWPFAESIRLSFTDWDGISKPNYVGLENYQRLWHDDLFWNALENNLKVLIAVPILVLVPLFVAALLQSRVPGWAFFRTVFFFPTLLSPAVVAMMFTLILRENGPLNGTLRFLHLGSFARLWLLDPHWALIWIIVIACWGFLGVGVVIYLAAMGSVDTNLIDAARIDGASWLRVQRHIVFPEILPVIELMTVLSIIGSFTNFFGLILLITRGGPSYSTTTADLYAYKLAFEQFEPGYASAVTVVLLIVSVTAGGAAFAFFRRKRA